MYDPASAHFISPDPVVTHPFFGQSYNRYGYVLQNPMTLRDPTGFNDTGSGTGSGTGGGGSGSGGSQNNGRSKQLCLLFFCIGGNQALEWGFFIGIRDDDPPSAGGDRGGQVNPGRSDDNGSTSANGRAAGSGPRSGGGGGRTSSSSPGGGRTGGGAAPTNRTGWDLVTKTHEWSHREIRYIEHTRLPHWFVKNLQPLFDTISKQGMLDRIDLSKVEVHVGTDDGRGRWRPDGFLLPTPGEGPTVYENTLRTVLHELGHVVQGKAMGQNDFLERWRAEREAYGDSDDPGGGAYNVPGTLEWRADRFRDMILKDRAKYGF
jgi:hypothetical protein